MIRLAINKFARRVVAAQIALTYFRRSVDIVSILRDVRALPRDRNYTKTELAYLYPVCEIPKAGQLIFFSNSENNEYSYIGMLIDANMYLSEAGTIRPIDTCALLTDPFKLKPNWWN